MDAVSTLPVNGPPLLLDGHRPEAILRAVQLLRRGAVVAVPTDTGYGLAASLFQPEALERVYEIKQRDARNPSPVLLGTATDLPLVVREVPTPAWRLIERFWPGPLTLVLPAAEGVSRVVTSGGDTVGVRVPGGRACLQVLESLGEPVTGTSANLSGKPGARTAAEVVEGLGPRVDAVLEEDEAVVHAAPSSVVEVTDSGLTIHRAGMLDSDALWRVSNTRVVAGRQLPPSPYRR
jgi:L-threonylcarbamoyladenylate synthase